MVFTDYIVADLAGPNRNALVGGPFGSNLVSRDYVDTGVPVIRGQNMGSRWVSGNFAFVSEEKSLSLKANQASAGDLLFTQRGTLGQVAIVPENVYKTYIVSQSQMKLTVDTSIADSLFLYYVFSSPQQLDYIRNNSIQTGVPHTNLGVLRNTPVSLPCLAAQKSIAKILGTLDDKIELNRQTNETLEAMAQAMFKSWFVDFDPVIDNALVAGNDIPEPFQARAAVRVALGDARKPLPEEIRCEFPDEFVFSDEMGWVPCGWGVLKVKDALMLQYGKALPARDRMEGTIPVFGSGGVSGFHNELLVEGPGIVVGRKGTVGSLYWVDEDFYPIDTVFFVEALREIPLRWIYRYLLTLDIKSMSADSAVPGVNRNVIYAQPLVKPPTALLTRIDVEIAVIDSQQSALKMESSTLESVRDTLLPKLLSGQLIIPNAEKLAAEAL